VKLLKEASEEMAMSSFSFLLAVQTIIFMEYSDCVSLWDITGRDSRDSDINDYMKNLHGMSLPFADTIKSRASAKTRKEGFACFVLLYLIILLLKEGIIHGDLHSNNVLICSKDGITDAVVIDFGRSAYLKDVYINKTPEAYDPSYLKVLAKPTLDIFMETVELIPKDKQFVRIDMTSYFEELIAKGNFKKAAIASTLCCSPIDYYEKSDYSLFGYYMKSLLQRYQNYDGIFKYATLSYNFDALIGNALVARKEFYVTNFANKKEILGDTSAEKKANVDMKKVDKAIDILRDRIFSPAGPFPDIENAYKFLKQINNIDLTIDEKEIVFNAWKALKDGIMDKGLALRKLKVFLNVGLIKMIDEQEKKEALVRVVEEEMKKATEKMGTDVTQQELLDAQINASVRMLKRAGEWLPSNLLTIDDVNAWLEQNKILTSDEKSVVVNVWKKNDKAKKVKEREQTDKLAAEEEQSYQEGLNARRLKMKQLEAVRLEAEQREEARLEAKRVQLERLAEEEKKRRNPISTKAKALAASVGKMFSEKPPNPETTQSAPARMQREQRDDLTAGGKGIRRRYYNYKKTQKGRVNKIYRNKRTKKTKRTKRTKRIKRIKTPRRKIAKTNVMFYT
jgi:hypothetical protein